MTIPSTVNLVISTPSIPWIVVGYYEMYGPGECIHWEWWVHRGPGAGDEIARYVAGLWGRGFRVRISLRTAALIQELDRTS